MNNTNFSPYLSSLTTSAETETTPPPSSEARTTPNNSENNDIDTLETVSQSEIDEIINELLNQRVEDFVDVDQELEELLDQEFEELLEEPTPKNLSDKQKETQKN